MVLVNYPRPNYYRESKMSVTLLQALNNTLHNDNGAEADSYYWVNGDDTRRIFSYQKDSRIYILTDFEEGHPSDNGLLIYDKSNQNLYMKRVDPFQIISYESRFSDYIDDHEVTVIHRLPLAD